MGFLRRQGPWEKNIQAMHTVAQMLTGSGARGVGAGFSRGRGRGGGGCGGQEQEQTARGCGVSLTLGRPGLSSGYQGQGKPQQTQAGQTQAGMGAGGGLSLEGGGCSSAPLGCLQLGKFLAQEMAGQKPSVRPGWGEDADPWG